MRLRGLLENEFLPLVMGADFLMLGAGLVILALLHFYVLSIHNYVRVLLTKRFFSTALDHYLIIWLIVVK